MNPYFDTSFFSFLALFFKRIFLLISGEISLSSLASDEIQIFALIGISISSATLGSFLVLKRMTMFANALSHTALLGLVGSFLFLSFLTEQKVFHLDIKVLFLGAMVAAFLTAFLIEGCKKWFSLGQEASIGLIFTFLFAIGISLVSLFAKGAHLGTEAIMGNIDALHIDDLKLISFSTLLCVLVVTLFFRHFQIISFDVCFAKSIGMPVSLLHYLLMFLTALTAICSFRVVGVFLFLIYLTAPVISARLFVKRVKSLILLSCLFGAIVSLISIAFSRHLLSVYDEALSTAGLSCTLMTLLYPASLLALKMRKYVVKSKIKETSFFKKEIDSESAL